MTQAVSYEEHPYPRLTFPYTHPQHLAMMATLLGLQPAPAQSCRVLEIGCAQAANLLPMAYTLPGSRFVGVDLSPGQIAAGQQVVDALALTNIELRCANIMEVDERWGRFDYIVAHGVYSWVPDPVKARLLALCGELLAPHGVAYISYKTYPGGHVSDMLREMCLFHNRDVQDTSRWARSTRDFLHLLRTGTPRERTAYRAAVVEHCDTLEAEAAGALVHDDLEADSDPVYFHEFMRRAAACGLQYLGDADFQAMSGGGLESATLEAIRQTGDWIEYEQYLDFLYGRSFRTTLLCRAEALVERQIVSARLAGLLVGSSLTPVNTSGEPLAASEVQLDGSVQEFRAAKGLLEATAPLAKAALLCLLKAAPRAVSFEELVGDAQGRIGNAAGSSDFATLGGMILEWYAAHFVDLYSHQPPLAVSAGDLPRASELARYQSAQGWEITNLLHRTVKLPDELAKGVLVLLDGAHDLRKLVAALAEPVLTGRLEMRLEGRAVKDRREIERRLGEQVEAYLQGFVRDALLLPAADGAT